jgi:hypothetical protein
LQFYRLEDLPVVGLPHTAAKFNISPRNEVQYPLHDKIIVLNVREVSKVLKYTKNQLLNLIITVHQSLSQMFPI